MLPISNVDTDYEIIGEGAPPILLSDAFPLIFFH